MMAVESVSINCPGCGAPISVNASNCPYCGRAVYVQSFEDISSMSGENLSKYYSSYQGMSSAGNNDKAEFALGLCCLKTAQFSEATTAFKKAIQNNAGNPDYYFYLAIALLEGKRPYMTSPQVLRDAERQLTYAMNKGGKGIYYYLAAYIKKDYYEKRFLRTDKTSTQLLEEAKNCGLPNGDIAILNALFDKPIQI